VRENNSKILICADKTRGICQQLLNLILQATINIKAEDNR